MATFPVVLDADVLFGMGTRDLLMRLSSTGLFRPHWSHLILDEVVRNVIKQGRADPARIARTVDLMNRHQPGALVDPPPELVDAMCNDPKDRHVLALAVHTGSSVIVTRNLSDFPADCCRRHAVEAQDLDDFLTNLIHLDSVVVREAIVQMSADYANPPLTCLKIVQMFCQAHRLKRAMDYLTDLEGHPDFWT